MKKKWMPREMKTAPQLDHHVVTGPPVNHHVLFINPFYTKDPNASFGKHVLTPSLALTSIAGATPGDWTFRYWDENLQQGPPPRQPFPQVVGITVHLTFAKRAYALSKWYRDRGARVILGGLHIQSCPQEALPNADAIVVGNGVAVWHEVLKDIDNNTLQKVYVGSYEMEYENEPMPNRNILPQKNFLTLNSMIATRGCNNRCAFCYLSTKGLRQPKQCRRIEQVVEEFKHNNHPYGVFVDNNLGSNRIYLKALCRALRSIKKIWSAAVTIDITSDLSLVREMALSGCTGVFVGFETLNDRNLKDARKRTPKTKEYGERVKIFHNYGIQVNGSFVFGFDHDRKDVFERTLQWIESIRLECATFHILTPYPGTPLFRKLDREGRLLHKNWDLYDTAHAVFQPRHMSPEELEEGYSRCYEKLFSHASIWHRRPSAISSVIPYLVMAYLYKRSNRLWHIIIKHRMTSMVWRPLIEVTRLFNLRYRKRLYKKSRKKIPQRLSMISAGV